MNPSTNPPVRAVPKAESANGRGQEGCNIGDLFRLLGKSYVMDILYLFLSEKQGARRFVDMQDRLKISPNTLSERLKELVKAGLLTRTAYNEIPPRVDYEATEKARELKTVFESMRVWAKCNTLEPLVIATPKPK